MFDAGGGKILFHGVDLGGEEPAVDAGPPLRALSGSDAAGRTFIGGVPTKRAANMVAGFSYSAAGAALNGSSRFDAERTWMFANCSMLRLERSS